MPSFDSPFLAVPADDWLCSNELAFAIFDQFPVSPGHVLVTTRRIVETWFDLLASFIQPSGLDLIQQSIFAALRAEARIRILVGDYLYITSAEALRRLRAVYPRIRQTLSVEFPAISNSGDAVSRIPPAAGLKTAGNTPATTPAIEVPDR